MRPDFIVRQRETKDGVLQVFIPAIPGAQEWMIANTIESERQLVSAQLTAERAAEFRAEAKSAGFKFSDEMLQPRTA
jgi:predicted nuclease of restriction endonuclease-like RecB superfamily